ncbi:MAG: type II toxin-antitoxin system YafQ family toxin [Selenomonas sp.]|uniref:type II toxin-antitoxin system YafQ family toxin n=1 Tax=Selenomonas sp. TaxID=2053611 RepID=UPI0025D5B97E|nr:type II toxin-antitoxin system YafQ family toxin [Selenomonas sp.]MCI6233343.1 type II toxin-antitoxin system YafQ family toxin [Selenomonas sp.]
MKKTKYHVKATSQFKREYKLAMKRGRDIELLNDVIEILAEGESLEEKYGSITKLVGLNSFEE